MRVGLVEFGGKILEANNRVNWDNEREIMCTGYYSVKLLLHCERLQVKHKCPNLKKLLHLSHPIGNMKILRD